MQIYIQCFKTEFVKSFKVTIWFDRKCQIWIHHSIRLEVYFLCKLASTVPFLKNGVLTAHLCVFDDTSASLRFCFRSLLKFFLFLKNMIFRFSLWFFFFFLGWDIFCLLLVPFPQTTSNKVPKGTIWNNFFVISLLCLGNTSSSLELKVTFKKPEEVTLRTTL